MNWLFAAICIGILVMAAHYRDDRDYWKDRAEQAEAEVVRTKRTVPYDEDAQVIEIVNRPKVRRT